MEANKRLLEAAVCDDSLAPRKANACDSERREPNVRESKAVRRACEETSASALNIAESQSQEGSLARLRQQLAELQSVIGDQATDRERGRVQEQWLRRQLIASEQRTTDLQEQLDESRQQLDRQQGTLAQQICDLNRQHNSDMEYLRATAQDAERRALKLDEQLRDCETLEKHQAESQQTHLDTLRREHSLEVQTKDGELANAARQLERLQTQLIELQGQLKISESIRDQQAKEMARVGRQYQIAEQLVRDNQRASA